MQQAAKTKTSTGQVVGLVVIAVLLAIGYVALDFYSAGEKNATTVESRGLRIIQGLTRYKLESGAYPDALAKLQPKFLEAVPVCPNGSAFAYQLAGAEFTLRCDAVIFRTKPYGYESKSKAWSG